MRVCVFGAGAIGGHLAVRLARGGAAVSVVARGPNLAAIHDAGLTVEAPDGRHHCRVRASDQPAELGPQDAVVVTVKAYSLPSVAAAITPLLGPATPVVFVMNGIPWWYFIGAGGEAEGRRLPKADPGDAMRNAVGAARTVGGVIWSACTTVAPGVVEVANARSRIALGEPDGRPSPRAEALAAVLSAGGMEGEVTDRIRDMIWSKLLLNLSSGPMSVLTQANPRTLAAEPACVEASRHLMAEAIAIARALGCRVDLDPEAQIKINRDLSHVPSITQDLLLGRPMEIDALFDAPRELGAIAGVATPMLDLLVAMARVRAQVAGLYPDPPPAQVFAPEPSLPSG
jgi:2-dehydropantoate 2-reductase